MLPTICQAAIAVVSITAAVYDIRIRKIPNWLVLAGFLSGITANTWLLHWAGLRASLLGLLLAFAIYLPLYLLRGMGAGDVKLMAAIGSIAGPSNWLVIFIFTALLGGVAAVVILLGRGGLGRALTNVGFILTELAHMRPPYAREELDVGSDKGARLPHGVVIAGGTLLFLGAAQALAQ